MEYDGQEEDFRCRIESLEAENVALRSRVAEADGLAAALGEELNALQTPEIAAVIARYRARCEHFGGNGLLPCDAQTEVEQCDND